jgi:hypothetical protein
LSREIEISPGAETVCVVEGNTHRTANRLLKKADVG